MKLPRIWCCFGVNKSQMPIMLPLFFSLQMNNVGLLLQKMIQKIPNNKTLLWLYLSLTSHYKISTSWLISSSYYYPKDAFYQKKRLEKNHTFLSIRILAVVTKPPHQPIIFWFFWKAWKCLTKRQLIKSLEDLLIRADWTRVLSNMLLPLRLRWFSLYVLYFRVWKAKQETFYHTYNYL